jgi:hypothetical protein
MQFNKATLRERQRLMVLQTKFEREDLRFEAGLDEAPCKYTGYTILLRDHIRENEVQGAH